MHGREVRVVRCYPQVCDWRSFAFYEVALQDVVLDVQVGYRTPDLKVNSGQISVDEKFSVAQWTL